MSLRNDDDPRAKLRRYYLHLAEKWEKEADRCRRDARMYSSSGIIAHCLEAAADFEASSLKLKRMAEEISR